METHTTISAVKQQREDNLKCKQLSTAQKDTLVNFVYARPNMQTQRFSATYTKAVSDALWGQLAAILNAMPGGAVKDPQKWNKTWRDLRKNVKNKTANQKKYAQGTGGGPPLIFDKSEDKTTDEKIVEILTPVAIEGNLEVLDTACINVSDTENEANTKVDKITHGDSINYPFQPDASRELPSTSGAGTKKPKIDKKVIENKENISGKTGKGFTKPRYTKTSRLTDSIRNNKNFLNISEKGIMSTNKYRVKKLEILKEHYQKKHEYYNQKIAVLNEISSSFNSVATDINLLQEHFQ